MDSYRHEGLRFDVRDGGPPDGEVVVLLHGFPQDATAWDAVTPSLHRAGLRTLAPDLRGYSPGARPTGAGAYTASRWSGDLLALLDAAGVGRAHLVGHDWGGAVVWTLACRHPDRVADAVVLSTPHPRALARSLVTGAQALRSWYMALFQLPVLPELLLSLTLTDSLRRGGLPADRAEHYAARMREPGALTAALDWYRGMGRSLLRDALPISLPGTGSRRGPPGADDDGPARPPATGGGRAGLPDCPVPTTYVWGRADPVLGRSAAEATARYVSGPYRFVELAAGHWLPETHPREVAEVIRARVRPGGAG